MGEPVFQYLKAKEEVRNNYDTYIIKPGDTKGIWYNKIRPAWGESKVTKFLIKRQLILQNMEIKDNLYIPPSNLEAYFVSGWLTVELTE